MKLHWLGNIILFVLIYIVVLGLLAKVGIIAAVYGAAMATKWINRNFK